MVESMTACQEGSDASSSSILSMKNCSKRQPSDLDNVQYVTRIRPLKKRIVPIKPLPNKNILHVLPDSTNSSRAMSAPSGRSVRMSPTPSSYDYYYPVASVPSHSCRSGSSSLDRHHDQQELHLQKVNDVLNQQVMKLSQKVALSHTLLEERKSKADKIVSEMESGFAMMEQLRKENLELKKLLEERKSICSEMATISSPQLLSPAVTPQTEPVLEKSKEVLPEISVSTKHSEHEITSESSKKDVLADKPERELTPHPEVSAELLHRVSSPVYKDPAVVEVGNLGPITEEDASVRSNSPVPPIKIISPPAASPSCESYEHLDVPEEGCINQNLVLTNKESNMPNNNLDDSICEMVPRHTDIAQETFAPKLERNGVPFCQGDTDHHLLQDQDPANINYFYPDGQVYTNIMSCEDPNSQQNNTHKKKKKSFWQRLCSAGDSNSPQDGHVYPYSTNDATYGYEQEGYNQQQYNNPGEQYQQHQDHAQDVQAQQQFYDQQAYEQQEYQQQNFDTQQNYQIEQQQDYQNQNQVTYDYDTNDYQQQEYGNTYNNNGQDVFQDDVETNTHTQEYYNSRVEDYQYREQQSDFSYQQEII